MPALQTSIMNKLYGSNVWAGFEVDEGSELQGWAGDHPSLSLFSVHAPNKIVVDVGVWKGQSTINMALSMKNANIDGVVIAVDTFLGSVEHWDLGLFSRSHAIPNLYRTFMSNVIKAGVQDYIVPMPQTSVTAAQILKTKDIAPTLVHIDTAHEYEEVLRDAEMYFDILQPGGHIIGDDYFAVWPGVIQAAGEMSARYKLPLQIDGVKWILHKPA